jgi:hypothetical protein
MFNRKPVFAWYPVRRTGCMADETDWFRPARFEMDLRDFSCNRRTLTYDAQGFQCVVDGHYLVVYSAHCTV